MIDAIILLIVLIVFADGIVGAWRKGEVDILARVWTKADNPAAFWAVVAFHIIVAAAVFALLLGLR